MLNKSRIRKAKYTATNLCVCVCVKDLHTCSGKRKNLVPGSQIRTPSSEYVVLIFLWCFCVMYLGPMMQLRTSVLQTLIDVSSRNLVRILNHCKITLFVLESFQLASFLYETKNSYLLPSLQILLPNKESTGQTKVLWCDRITSAYITTIEI